MKGLDLKVKPQSGFTIVELIVVIVISGILSVVLIPLIVGPIDSYTDVSRRMRLVDIADSAMQKLAFDIKTALPNSIRVGCGGQCVEFLRAPAGGRYRASPGNDGGSPVTDVLHFVTDTSFPVVGPLDFTGFATGTAGDCVNNNASCVVVYNTGLTGTDAWNGDNIATLAAGSSASTINFINTEFVGGGSSFPSASPNQRFFLVDTPVKYVCNPAASTQVNPNGGTILRYQGFSFDPASWTMNSTPASTPALLADHISGCSFRYDVGTDSRNAVLTIDITVSEFDSYSNVTEDVDLFQQVRVLNLP